MLDQLKPDIQELINLVRQAENYDATLAAAQLARRPINLGADSVEERRRKGDRIVQQFCISAGSLPRLFVTTALCSTPLSQMITALRGRRGPSGYLVGSAGAIG